MRKGWRAAQDERPCSHRYVSAPYGYSVLRTYLVILRTSTSRMLKSSAAGRRDAEDGLTLLQTLGSLSQCGSLAKSFLLGAELMVQDKRMQNNVE